MPRHHVPGAASSEPRAVRDAAADVAIENLAVYARWGRDLVAAMDSCDRRDAVMVDLVYGRQLTHLEVSAELGLPLQVIHEGVARGLRQIGRTLVPEPDHSVEAGAR